MFDVIDADTGLHVDTPANQRPSGPLRQRRMERSEHPVGRFDERDRNAVVGELREVPSKDLVDELAQTAGHLDARRPAADDDHAEVDRSVRTAACLLEPRHEVVPDRERVVNRLQREGVGVDSGDPEVRADAPCRDDEEVVVDAPTVIDRHGSFGEVDGPHGTEHESGRTMRADDRSHRKTDVVAVEAGRGHLVQQRLEGVEVVRIDDRHGDLTRCTVSVEIEFAEALRDSDSTEPRADHHHVNSLRAARRFGHGVRLLGHPGDGISVPFHPGARPGASGTVNRNVAPLPGRADDATTSPPCARARLRAIVRPIPRPARSGPGVDSPSPVLR